MKRLITVMCLVVFAATGIAFEYVGSGGGGKRINATVNGLISKGPAWSAAANYSSNARYSHVVIHSGSTWAAIQNSNNQTPSDGSMYWWKYIAQGPAGINGAAGAKGDKGDTGTVTASTGLTVIQRQHSSHSVTMYPPLDNDPTGARPVTWTVSPGSNRAGQVAYSSGKLLVDGAQITGTSGGGTAFETKTRNVYTNMSSGKYYEPAAFAKHVLPLAGANKSLYVQARTSSAHISTNSETGVIRQLGGITAQAGYTVRVPKGSLYWFVATQSGYWEAFKLIGSDITQYIADFAAVLGISPTTKTFADTATGSSSATQAFTVSNTGNATGNLGTFALYSTNADQFTLSDNTCGATLAPSASCGMNVAFAPTTTGAKTASIGDGTLSAVLSGTGTGGSPSLQLDLASNPTGNLAFIGTTGRAKIGGSFTTTGAFTLTSVKVKLKVNAGVPLTSSVNVYLYSNNSGAPGTLLATSSDTITGTIPPGGSTYTYYLVNFAGSSLSATTRYWIVMDGAIDAVNVPGWGDATGTEIIAAYNGTSWSNLTTSIQASMQLYGY